MAFPRKLLNSGEDVVLDLRPHWRSYAGPAAALALAVAALVAAAALDLNEWLQLALGAVTVAALAWFAGRYARWATTNFVVTTDRLVYRAGVLSRHGIEIPLERVNTVFSSQSLLERLLRSGDLVIESGGERGRQHFADIARPAQVQAEIYRQIEANQARAQRAGSRGGGIAAQLEELHDLRRRGFVTQAEFDAKRADLLARM